jgi:benzoylformate decarboxylase
VVHFDLNAYEIAKNHRVDLGIVCDPRTALNALSEVLTATMDDSARTAAAGRLETMRRQRLQKDTENAEQDRRRAASSHATMESFAAELARRLPADAILFDEALTNSPPLTRAIAQHPGRYFCTRGGSLGIGIPGAIGAKLAHPDRAVFGFTGDGGSMYTIQALYTAAKYSLDINFVICHNQRYKLLDLNISHYWADQGLPNHAFPEPFDLSTPDLGFVEMARGMGVDGVRVERADEIAPAIAQALNSSGPFLIDLVLQEETNDQRAGLRCGQ